MPLTYRCELHITDDPESSECKLDKDGFGSCGDGNIKRDCLWGRWTTKSHEEFKKALLREYTK